jgi:site-specific DNA recombinase
MRENILNGFRAGGIAPIGYLREKIVVVTREGLPVPGLGKSTGTFIGIEDNALAYAGHTVWFRHKEKTKGRPRRATKVRPSEDWEIDLNTHEAMISDVQAETIMAKRALKSRSQQRGRRSPYLLSGVLRCVCGANFVGDAGGYPGATCPARIDDWCQA